MMTPSVFTCFFISWSFSLDRTKSSQFLELHLFMLDEQRHLAAGGIMTRLLGAKKEVSSCYTGCLHSQHHVGPTPEPALHFLFHWQLELVDWWTSFSPECLWRENWRKTFMCQTELNVLQNVFIFVKMKGNKNQQNCFQKMFHTWSTERKLRTDAHFVCFKSSTQKKSPGKKYIFFPFFKCVTPSVEIHSFWVETNWKICLGENSL